MISKNIDEYLDKKGSKYFVTLAMLFYVLGTAIFNIYLRSLGVSEFDLVKLRYALVGFTFTALTLLVPLSIFFLRKLFHHIKKTKLTDRMNELFSKRLEITIGVLLIPWLIVYALYLFPLISSGFGGAKPILARLIGKIEDIKGINELIAFETGVPVEKLPFERATEDSDLAVGANVMILDRNTSRIFLLLTKDLYLSSTSRLAKDLISLDKRSHIETSETRNFKPKPLIVDAGKIQGITLSLYEPPEVLTAADIEVAAAALAFAPEDQARQQIVSDFIAERAPEAAPQVLAAVQQHIERKRVQAATPAPSENTTNLPIPSANEEPSAQETQEDTAELVREFEKFFDSEFLSFRAEIFGQASTLCGVERKQGKQSESRFNLVRSISAKFDQDFPEAWANLQKKNFLVDGQDDENFACTLVHIFQGAENADRIVTRLNETKPFLGPTFTEVRDGALEILTKSSQVNDYNNRKYVSRIIIQHFNQKARKENEFWNTPKYLSNGRDDESFFANIRTALTETETWEEFRDQLTAFEIALEAQLEEQGLEVPAEDGGEILTPPAEETPPPAEETPPVDQAPPAEETPPPADTPPAEG